jgi:hypothetical protein
MTDSSVLNKYTCSVCHKDFYDRTQARHHVASNHRDLVRQQNRKRKLLPRTPLMDFLLINGFPRKTKTKGVER